jgi:glycosyltransferase involved in cell wall biosynthesis
VIAHTVTGLAARHEVGLLYLRAAGEQTADDRTVRSCAFAEPVVRASIRGPLRRSGRLLAWLAAGRPVWVAEWKTTAYAQRLSALAAEWRPDLVQIEFQVMGQYIDSLADCSAPVVLSVHESGTVAAEDERRVRRGAVSAGLKLDTLAWRRYERELVGRVDVTTVWSERDRRALAELVPAARIVRVPPGIPSPAEPLSSAGRDPKSVLFVGSFRHKPNIEAAVRLVKSILPLVRVRHPDALLTIVGEQPPARLRRLATPGVVITGAVPDIHPYLDAAAVVAAPVFTGGGFRVKVLEAFAAGKAVVASPLAAGEIGGAHVVLAENDAEFVDRISDLLDDARARARLGAAARTWALKYAAPEATIAAFESVYGSLLPGAASRRGP